MRDVPLPAYAGDTGDADPDVRAALAAVTAEPPTYLAAVAELCLARLLVPIMAVSTSRGEDGADQTSEMAMALLNSDDGSALLAFTGLDALAAWRSDARPSPVTLDQAARVARDAGADRVLVDVAGPTPLIIEQPILGQLADGHRLVRIGAMGEYGWLRPAR